MNKYNPFMFEKRDFSFNYVYLLYGLSGTSFYYYRYLLCFYLLQPQPLEFLAFLRCILFGLNKIDFSGRI